MFCLQFVVIRFYPTTKDPEEYMEVSLASWLVGDLDDNMNGVTLWPPDSKPISQLVKNEAPADSKWDKFKIQVMRFYGMYFSINLILFSIINFILISNGNF